MKKRIHIVSFISAVVLIITAVILVPVFTLEARERGDRTHPTERPSHEEPSTPEPEPEPEPEETPEPIIVPQELLERWQAMLEQGLFEEVEKEYRAFVEDGIYPIDEDDSTPQDPPDEEPPAECTEEENDEEVSDRIRDRVVHRSRGNDSDPVVTPCDEGEQDEPGAEEEEQPQADPEPQNDPDEDSDPTYVEAIALEIHRLTNIEREKMSLPLLMNDLGLEGIAQTHSDHMALNNFFSHTTIDGCDLTCRFEEAGYSASAWGENIAWRSSSVLPSAEDAALAFVISWINSSGHRDNMLSSTFTHEGVGIALVGNKVFATVDFASP